MLAAEIKERRSAGGRPTREAALRREERVLDVASVMFLEQGFDATSIDSIAVAAGIGKPSLYARYGDKSGLFLAVLRRKIACWVKPFAELAPLPDRPMNISALERVLVKFGRHCLEASLAPEAVALARILTAEATRFPDLARLMHEEGWMQGVRHLAALMTRTFDFSRSAVRDPDLAADLFLSLVLGRLCRQALLGIPVDRASLDARVKAAVKLFLGSGLVLR